MFVFLKSQVLWLNGSTEVVPNQLVNTNLRQLFVVFGLRVLEDYLSACCLEQDTSQFLQVHHEWEGTLSRNLQLKGCCLVV